MFYCLFCPKYLVMTAFATKLLGRKPRENVIVKRTVMIRMKVVMKHQTSLGHVPFRIKKETMFTLMRTYPYMNIMRSKKIKYPYSEDIAQQFYERMQGEGDVYNLPKQLMPDICENMKCSKHNNEFSTEATDLVLVSKNTVIYRVLSDKILDVQVFARKTKQIPGEKRCQCLLQVDGHRWLLWHVGKGRMVDYAYLNFYLHQKVKGKGILEAWTTRNSAFESNNYQSSLMFKTFQKAAFGYENRLEFPPDAFICDDCTLSTKYIVFDGKVVGPKKHAIDH